MDKAKKIEVKTSSKKPVVNGGSIFVHYGVNAIKLSANYSGKTISDITEKVSGVLNLPEVAVAVLNGKVVENDNTRVKAGDEIEFVKAAGSKA